MSYIHIEGTIKIPLELFHRLNLSDAAAIKVTEPEPEAVAQPEPVAHTQAATVGDSDSTALPTVILEGYNRNFSWMPTDLTELNGMTVEYLHRGPTVALIRNVLSPQECQQLVDHYRNDSRLQRATVHNSETGEMSVSEHRTNSLMWMQHGEHPLLEKADHRLSEITTIPSSHGELFQMMKYTQGQEFKPHDDFFYHLGPQSNYAQVGQRIATAILYLQPPLSGGSTVFPELGLDIAAEPGSALYFEYTDQQGVCTTLCRHAGTPVQAGEKWNLTKWYRQRPWS